MYESFCLNIDPKWQGSCRKDNYKKDPAIDRKSHMEAGTNWWILFASPLDLLRLFLAYRVQLASRPSSEGCKLCFIDGLCWGCTGFTRIPKQAPILGLYYNTNIYVSIYIYSSILYTELYTLLYNSGPILRDHEASSDGFRAIGSLGTWELYLLL